MYIVLQDMAMSGVPKVTLPQAKNMTRQGGTGQRLGPDEQVHTGMPAHSEEPKVSSEML